MGNTMLWDAATPEEEERFKKIIEDRVRHSPFYELMGMEVTRLARGRAELKIEAKPHHCDENGTVHPGVIFALADAASGVAMATLVPYGSRRVVTVEMKANFIAQAGAGALAGAGEVLQAGEDIAVSEAEVRDTQGNTIARSIATFMKIGR